MARDLFDELRLGGAAAVDQLVKDARQESVDLEFKTKANSTTPDLDKSDKEVLSRAVSALANSAGGVLLWGVATTKVDGIEQISGPVPIANATKFADAIDRVIPQAVTPRLDVAIAPIAAASGDGSGFVVMRVERSDRRPHRSEFGIKSYWKRIGGRSMQMEHYDIEDAFKRNAVAELKVTANVERGHVRRDGQLVTGTFHVHIWLENPSNVSARFPYVHFETSRAGLGDYEGGADNVVHPGNRIRIARGAVEGLTSSPYVSITERELGSLEIPSTEIACKFGCLHSRQRWAGFRIFGRGELEILPTPTGF